MKVTMMLCDAAQASDGKLYILGGGWALTGPEPTPSAVAVLIDVPWDLANESHPFSLVLRTEDGEPVLQPGPNGPAPVAIEGRVEVGRPAGVAPGSALSVPIAINVGPLQLTPGARYVWSLTVSGETRDEWRLPFAVRPAPPKSGGPVSPTSF